MAMKGHKPPKMPQPAHAQALNYVDTLNKLQRDLLPLAEGQAVSGQTGLVTIPTWTTGTWALVNVPHGLGHRPSGYAGYLTADGSPSVASSIPVTSSFADATNLSFMLFNTTTLNLSGSTVNLSWIAWP